MLKIPTKTSAQPLKIMLMIKFTLIFILIKSNGCIASGLGSQLDYDLLLAGGALRTCSSMSLRNCRVSDFSENKKQALLYQFSSENAERFLELGKSLSVDNKQLMQLHSTLLKSYAGKKDKRLARSDFFDALISYGLTDEFIRKLADPLYFAVLDTHEATQIDSNGLRKQEQANVGWTNSEATQDIYQTFVDLAKHRVKGNGRPRIAVVTASSRDPFESADFYLSVFDSLGADVVWLPLDATYQKARFIELMGGNGCQRIAEIRKEFNSFERERIYPLRTALQLQYCQQPELLRDLLANVQGVFFNGGDQSRTLAALTNPLGRGSVELALIKQQLGAKQLVVGGTSAGTAVQSGGYFAGAPVPMISSGQSDSAMQNGAFPVAVASERCTSNCQQSLNADALTYKPQGGTGLFSLGILDTHFSERDREARLAVLAAESGQRYAFGVDETTALLVGYGESEIQLRVIGQNGVFMIDRAGSQYTVSESEDYTHSRRQFNGLANYLPTGTTARFEQQRWQFLFADDQITSRKKLNKLEQGVWRDKIRQWCNADKMIQWDHKSYVVALHADSNSKFFVSDGDEDRHCGYTGLPFLLNSSEP